MKRKLHFLLAVGIGLTASVGWLHAQDAKLAKDGNVTFKGKPGYTFVYAQGNPVTVTMGEDSATIITVDANQEQMTIPKDSVNKLYLFGGKKNGSVESTKITVKSGTIGNVFGGGYGELGGAIHAAVSGTSQIIVDGGSIHNIFGGGLYYCKSSIVEIKISDVKMGKNAWVMCGGLESGQTSGNIYPAYEASTNTVDIGTLNITGGIFCYVAIGGTDGAKGYVKQASANISNAHITGLFGNGSNGASDDVEGEIIGCHFAPMDGCQVEVAAINRGHVKNVKLEFRNCNFPDEGTACFVGGTSGWKKNYIGSQVEVVNPGTISYSFDGCLNTPELQLSDGLDGANVEVTGAKVRVAPFNNGVDDPVTEFKIGAGKTWTFNDGLLSDDGVKLTVDKKGTLNNRFFANGEPIDITPRDGGKKGVKIGTEEYDETLSVFGGSLNASVDNTYINMVGGTIRNLYGGGYGEGDKTSGKPANVNGRTNIFITNGTVSNLLVGGGCYYSKTPTVNMVILNSEIATLYAGGFDAGKTTNTLESTWDNCVNGVKSFELQMTGGTITEGLGCGGGQGYAHTESSIVEIRGTTLAAFYGVLSNGSAGSINADLYDCTFSALTDYYEFASVNRGKAGKINFTFSNCSFNDLDKMYANLGAVDGWASSDTDGSIVPAVTESVEFTFSDSKTKTPVMKVGQGLGETNIELTGAAAKIDSAMVSDKNGNKTWHTEFTLGEGKTWTFNDGLTLASGVTLTKNGTLQYTGTLEANVSTAAELEAAITLGAEVIHLADATYDLSNVLTLSKGVVLQGSDKSKCKLTGRLEVNPTDTVDIVLKNLTLTENESTNQTNTPMIDILGSKANLSLVDVDIIPMAPGAKSGRAAIALVSRVETSTIELLRTNISLTKNSQIGLFNDGGFCNFSMTDSKIVSGENVNSLSGLRCILTQGADNSTYTINNSELSVGDNFHYAIWVKSPKQHFVINDSKVYGWAAFYMQGAWYGAEGADEMTLKASNSSFTGVGKEGSSNGFGVIVFEATERSVVEMDNCVVTNKIIDSTKDYGFIPPIVFQMGGGTGTTTDRPSRKPSADCSVILKNCTIQNKAEATTPIFVSYENVLATASDGYIDYHGNKVSIDSNTKILNADGSKSILIQNGDTLRNASKTLPGALVYLDGSFKKVVAYLGDMITTELTAAKALAALNAEKAMPAGYVVPDSITIVCKDAYLVTGVEAAKAFADRVSDKAVFCLKQASEDTPVFSTFAAGNNRIKVSNSTTWDHANNANRSVEIAANATLTVNVAMPLDTVFMAEGAQLVANADVTAKAVQLIYGVKKTWKAFGFPFQNIAVTDLKGGSVVTTADQAAATGLWTATMKNDGEPVFGVTSTAATPVAPCIIAAHKDSTILVTSVDGLISLASKAEPNAPVPANAADVKFEIVSNPNTYDMTLTQTAYVLSADGKTFDRMVNPTIPAFQCFVLADEQRTNTLRSLRIGETPTGNETIVPVEGYYVQTGKGSITIHTAEPLQVTVVDMLGRVYYNARVNDGARIAVPAGIYAVNRQKVIVK